MDMQQRTIINNGRKFLVNVATNDDGVGPGFAVGQLVMKSSDGSWYMLTSSGSSPTATLFISQSALPFTSGPIYAQNAYTASIVGYMDFYEQNFPYQILGSTDGNAYAIYLTGTAPTVTLVVSQSVWGPAYITTSYNAVINTSKPGLILQNISDGNYYNAALTTSGSTTTLSMSQTVIPSYLVQPFY
jgi:hypothetical protein